MGVDSEKTKEYRTNEHFGVRNSDDHIFQVEHRDTFGQRKRASSSVFQLSKSSQQRSPMKRGRTDDNWAVLDIFKTLDEKNGTRG